MHHMRPNAWTVAKSIDWLVINPISANNNIALVKRTISNRIAFSERASLDVRPGLSPTTTPSSAGGNWIGKYPYLHLIHTIIFYNKIKSAFLSWHNVPSVRMSIKNRNTAAVCDSNIWQLVANTWNDCNFLPVTSVKVYTHSNFSRPIAVSFDLVEKLQPATMEKVEEKWNAMNLALKIIVQNWEHSGQGDGGFDGEEEDSVGTENKGSSEDNNELEGNKFIFGSLTKQPQKALDLQQHCIDGRSTYLLYLWDMLEEHQLFKSSMQQLNDGFGSCNGTSGVPFVIGCKRGNDKSDSLGSSKKTPRKNNMELLGRSIQKHGESMILVAHMAAEEQNKNRNESRMNITHAQINSLRDTNRSMVICMAAPNVIDNKEMKNVISQEIEGIENEITMNVEEMNALMAHMMTPSKTNVSPE